MYSNAIKEYLIGNDKVRLLIWDLVIKGLKVKNESFFKKYLSGSVNKGFRSNYYPPCPDPSKVVGLVVHTDSTLGLVQLGDVGGYQLMKDGVWMSVNPRKGENTLCINIGDYIEVDFHYVTLIMI
jgi:isopenicillin N synthase-like dioxygenase